MGVKDLEIGTLYIAYIHSRERGALQQAYVIIPLAIGEESVHIMESHRASKIVLKAFANLTFEDLSKRDGNVIRLFYNTWKEQDGEIVDERGNKVSLKKMNSL